MHLHRLSLYYSYLSGYNYTVLSSKCLINLQINIANKYWSRYPQYKSPTYYHTQIYFLVYLNAGGETDNAVLTFTGPFTSTSDFSIKVTQIECSSKDRYTSGCWVLSQRHFAKQKLPKGIFPNGNLPNVQFTKRQLPKSINLQWQAFISIQWRRLFYFSFYF